MNRFPHLTCLVCSIASQVSFRLSTEYVWRGRGGGVTLNQGLVFSKHVQNASLTCFHHLHQIRTICLLLKTQTTTALVYELLSLSLPLLSKRLKTGLFDCGLIFYSEVPLMSFSGRDIKQICNYYHDYLKGQLKFTHVVA